MNILKNSTYLSVFSKNIHFRKTGFKFIYDMCIVNLVEWNTGI
jgi:hypothetical protein